VVGIATFPRCHLDQRERSHAAIIRPKKGILGDTRFLASLRNDSGGGIMAFALPGTTRFLASLDMTGLSSRPSPTVMATNGRDLMQPSSAPRKASSATRDFSLRFEMTGRGIMAFALPGTTRFLAGD